MEMSVFVAGARVHFAKYLMQSELFLAIGTGNVAWDNEPILSPEEEALQMARMSQESALKNCVGVTRVRARSFVHPDASGSIAMNDGSKWSKVNVPTNWLFLEGMLDLADASDITVRETGIYVDTQLVASVPAGQMFVPISDVENLGTLIQLHRFPPIIRTGSIGQAINPILEL